MLGKYFKIITNSILAMLIFVGVLAAISFFPIPGNFKLLTVMSGSMEPKIHTGSLIFVKPVGEYNVGDVVTRKTNDPKKTITHRIINKTETDGETVFETKGDANNVSDGEEFLQESILGKVFFSLPYAGYPVGFAKTQTGLILIVVIPAVIIIYDELHKIKREFAEIRKKKKEEKEPKDEQVAEVKMTLPEKQYVRGAGIEAVPGKKRRIA